MTGVSRFGVPDLGVGVGFRLPHYAQILEEHPAMDWFEVISENFMVDGGSPLHNLNRLRERYPVIPHGVCLAPGGEGDPEHLRRLFALVGELKPPWFSDHLCWGGSSAARLHDLLPLPYRPEVLAHVVRRVREVQDRTGIPFAIENVSSYLSYQDSVMSEWEFLGRVAEEADCAILLDVNNIFVSSVNHGFDPYEYLDAVPVDRVVQVHLAGHQIRHGYRLDTHDHPVCDEVWSLYRAFVRKAGPVSTLIEWDDNIPTFERLQEEAARARRLRDDAALEHARAST